MLKPLELWDLLNTSEMSVLVTLTDDYPHAVTSRYFARRGTVNPSELEASARVLIDFGLAALDHDRAVPVNPNYRATPLGLMAVRSARLTQTKGK